jgi:hypothetical protein
VGEARMHRAVLRPLYSFAKRLIGLRAWSLRILATPPRHPLAHGFEGHPGFPTGRDQGGAAAQRDADGHLHRDVQLRRPAYRARVYVGPQIRQNWASHPYPGRSKMSSSGDGAYFGGSP